jgi:hypothetical protein
MIWLKSNLKLIGLVAVIAVAAGLYLLGRSHGKEVELAKCNKDKQEVIDENIAIRFEQDNVIRPDTVDYIKRLRDGSA